MFFIQSKIVPKDIQVGDSFGDSVSIDSGGDTIAIGASSKLSGGAMYIFIRSGTTWTQREKIVSSNLATGDKFGYSVGLSRVICLLLSEHNIYCNTLCVCMSEVCCLC